jgi:thiamine-phosphate pyrophosphorylase
MLKEYLATFIINDNVHLANNWMDGVHLGLSDMSVEEARLILGKTKNHRRHCKILLKTCSKNSRNCDYIGLGPYQFTTTKQHLSPILGLEGYRSIIEQMKAKTSKSPFMPLEESHWSM